MAEETTKKSPKKLTKKLTRKLTKKEARKEIYDKLAPVLSEYKNRISTKKFDRRLQKASKLFVPLLLKEKIYR